MRSAVRPATLADVSDDIELRTVWDAVVASTPRSHEVFDDLVGRHRQPHRRYHGVRHVVWVLRHARAIESAIPVPTANATYDRGAVTAAAFFHDAVYDPVRGDNEERSAVLAEHQLASIGWESPRCGVVAALVRATAGHLTDHTADLAERAGSDDAQRSTPSADELHVLLDADLGVLGSEPNAYAAYATGVRVEYRHLADDQWREGRADVLRHLLDREQLFGSAPARTWWEARARANLTAELATL